jgi:hypothetical protein
MDKHHEKVQQSERAMDWAWMIFFAHFVAYDDHAIIAYAKGIQPVFIYKPNSPAGKTTTGVEQMSGAFR